VHIQCTMFQWDAALFTHVRCGGSDCFLLCCRLLSFIQWVEARNPEVNLTQHGCFNPYFGAVEAPLSELSQPQQIAGCVPQVL
jgi:hypothetical protein